MADEPNETATQVQELLAGIRRGDESAEDELFELAYQDLRAIAQSLMNGQNPGHSLQATALVHEAWLRVSRGTDRNWVDENHFIAVASRAMRTVLVDHARSKSCLKRKASGSRVPLDDLCDEYEQRSADLRELDSALTRLAGVDEKLVRMVDLRFFGGLSLARTAQVLGISERSAYREWDVARAWLQRELR